ncbi:hypothetical protein CRG98_009785 [Punica granatum]|uniref:Uncharacterized protein n=1 Tax=Punica granatum TaxID=22663 RepID=A0A2I0KNJ1_PUNGR|nr:hypothetical protein CRG98_009785 [Punica granatum]
MEDKSAGQLPEIGEAREPSPRVASPRSSLTQASELGFVERETLSLSTSPRHPELGFVETWDSQTQPLGSRASSGSGGQIWGPRAMGLYGGVVATTTTMVGRRSELTANQKKVEVEGASDIFKCSIHSPSVRIEEIQLE